MAISFFDLLGNDGWEPLRLQQDDPSFYWNDGGFLRNAPVDIEATFDGAIWASANVEPAFKWRARRIQPGFVVPRRHQNLRQLMIVAGGQIDVEYGADLRETQQVGAGEFWVAEAEVPYRITVGPRGVTYLESWTEPISLVETYWHDDEHWKRR